MCYSFYIFLSSDLLNCDLNSFEKYLLFKKCRFLSNFLRFRPLKICFFQIEIPITMQELFNQILFDILRAEERIYFSSLALHILKSYCEHLTIRRKNALLYQSFAFNQATYILKVIANLIKEYFSSSRSVYISVLLCSVLLLAIFTVT